VLFVPCLGSVFISIASILNWLYTHLCLPFQLNDNFLQTFKDRPHENLRLQLLEKLVHDEIQLRRKKNLAKARSFDCFTRFGVHVENVVAIKIASVTPTRIAWGVPPPRGAI